MSDVRFDGLDAIALMRRLKLPHVDLLARTASTMDDAHALAANAALAGTLVIAHTQTAGRGRSGGSWASVDGESILCTLIERPASAAAVEVLSLRVGMAVAEALDAFCETPVGVKWPNDLMAKGGKVAGVLIEARWREGRPDWLAIAIGLNVGRAPEDTPGARGLNQPGNRLAVLDAIIPAMRRAATRSGELTEQEMAEWRRRDYLAGRRVAEPVIGTVGGILPSGELVIETPSGQAMVRSGSVKLENA